MIVGYTYNVSTKYMKELDRWNMWNITNWIPGPWMPFVISF